MDKYGWFDSGNYTPEEMIVAAGFAPARIVGNPLEPSVEADRSVQATHCYFARSVLDRAIKGEFADYAGVVITHGCDATSRQYDLWKLRAKDAGQLKALHYLNVPLKLDETAGKFLVVELERFKAHLEEVAGREITDADLHAAIETCNRTRGLLRDLAQYRNQPAPVLSATELFEATRAAQLEPKATANESLEALLAEVRQRAPPAGEGRSSRPRVLLTGSIVDHPALFQLIEDAGMDVVADDLDIGEDYFSTDVETTGDPLEALARFLRTKPVNSTKHPPDGRLDHLLALAKERAVDGVIYQTLKFCEPYLFDSVFITDALKDAGYPVLLFEREYSPQNLSQVQTRVEAFKELL